MRDIFSRIWNRQFLAWKLSRFLNDKNISRYIKEAKEDRLINSRLLEKTGYSWRDIDPLGIVVYAVVRSLKPKIVVETGVQSGISSLYILQALKKNNDGFLYSIDLPDREVERVGEAVPDHIRDSWHLIIGNSKELLPKLLEKLMSIDIFLHDSLHTYEHMFFEFECALKYLGENGLIVSHDILFNKAFEDFCAKYNLRNLKLYNIGFGLAKNESKNNYLMKNNITKNKG